MPKSTLSQRIAQLEDRLGLRLLNRSTRQVSLTSAGQIYLDHCRRIRDEARAASATMSRLKEQPSGTLRLTCPEVTALYFMPEFLHRFTQTCPQIDIELHATNQALDIIRERIDFAFRVGDVTGQGLIQRRISQISRVLVASPKYLEIAPILRLPEDLRQHRCLLQKDQRDWTFQSGETWITLQPSAVISSDSMGFLLQTASAGSGIAMLPGYVCEPALTAGRLLRLLPDWVIPSHEMLMVSPHFKQQSSAQAAFRGYVNGYDFSLLSAQAKRRQ